MFEPRSAQKKANGRSPASGGSSRLRGALAIALAVVVLIWPNIGLAALIALFGAFALISGLATIVAAFHLPIRAGSARGSSSRACSESRSA